jgi:hypothetical protein
MEDPMTTSNEASSAGSYPGDPLGQHGAHAGVGLDRPHVPGAPTEQRGESAGTRADLEHIGRAGRDQPPECLLGRAGPEAGVVIGDLTE